MAVIEIGEDTIEERIAELAAIFCVLGISRYQAVQATVEMLEAAMDDAPILEPMH